MALNKVEICGVNTSSLPILKQEEKDELFRRIKQGDTKAREQYIKGNLRLVLSVIRRFQNSNENPDDLFQIGCIGLMKAVDNFDDTLMVKFSTYAVPMIIGEIRRYLRDYNSIRVSRSLRDIAYKAIYAKENYIRQNLKRELAKPDTHPLIITQGFICRNAYGEIDNLKRGGSDYSAALVGAAIKAEEIQIWTDIDGFHNNDPRIVEGTKAIRHLSFDEAAELAYFGAKILHPSSVQPAKKENIPVRLKNTLCPDDEGTLITEDSPAKNVKAVAAKSGITAIKIKSTNMLLAYGFLRKVFEVFEAWKTPIDMIATSEVAVSLTIDCTEHLEEILKDLEKYGTIEVDRNMAIVCIVGDFSAGKSGLGAQVLKALEEVPLRMISYGGSAHNISVLVKEEDKKKAMTDLSHKLEDLQH